MIKQIKVLIVEDDPLIGDLIFSDLSFLYPNGNLLIIGPIDSYIPAIETINAETPDIVLLDIELGRDKMAGIQIANYINQTHPIPIIFLSGLDRHHGFEVAKLTAPFAYLSKPYKRQVLGDLIELLLIRIASSPKPSIETNSNSQVSELQKSLFVSTAYGELTAIPIKKLVLLEADGKVLKAFLEDQINPIVFTSPGLKKFVEKNINILGTDFFQLSRKHVIRLSKIQQIKDNQVKLPRFTSNLPYSFFSLPIPINGNKKNELYLLLGKKN